LEKFGKGTRQNDLVTSGEKGPSQAEKIGSSDCLTKTQVDAKTYVDVN